MSVPRRRDSFDAARRLVDDEHFFGASLRVRAQNTEICNCKVAFYLENAPRQHPCSVALHVCVLQGKRERGLCHHQVIKWTGRPSATKSTLQPVSLVSKEVEGMMSTKQLVRHPGRLASPRQPCVLLLPQHLHLPSIPCHGKLLTSTAPRFRREEVVRPRVLMLLCRIFL